MELLLERGKRVTYQYCTLFLGGCWVGGGGGGGGKGWRSKKRVVGYVVTTVAFKLIDVIAMPLVCYVREWL